MKTKASSDTPELILIVLDNKKDTHLERMFQKGLDRTGKSYVALSLYVAPRDLKNILKAVKLLGVAGIFITGKHRKKGVMLADVCKDKGSINTVVPKNGRYYGHNIAPKGGNSLKQTVAESIRIITGVS